MVQITFLGGADEVGASCSLLTLGGRRILVDAGIRISPRSRWGLQDDQLPDLSQIDRAGGLDAILVTHAHTDHTGALELIVERYNCPIYATPITIALSRVLHADARRIMQSRQDEEGELPLYDDLAVEKFLNATIPVPFNTRLPLGENVTATFFPAGHIAGAAMIGLESPEGRILFTGDLALTPQRSVDGAKVPAFHPDVLIIESTYGGRLHANRAAEERRLVDTVVEVTAAGGKVLIPAFALGRAQEILLILSEARRQGVWTTGTIWADGMVRSICQAYAQFPESLSLLMQERNGLFFDQQTRPVESGAQRQELIWQAEPWVMVASSGMLSGGASVAYARRLATQPENAILLTGYQDEESPGRKLLQLAETGGGTLRFGSDKVDVKCKIGAYSLSAHADESQLISFINALDPTEVCLVHGDHDARESMAARLRERGRAVNLPHSGQTLEFRFTPSVGRKLVQGIGTGKPLDSEALWKAVAGPVGGAYFSAEELSTAWWGKDHTRELESLLEKDDPYFEPLAAQPGLYRARTQAQILLHQQRVARLAALELQPGWVVILKDADNDFYAALCDEVAAGHFYLKGVPDPVWPDNLMTAFDPGEGEFDPAAVRAAAEESVSTGSLLSDIPAPLDALMEKLPASAWPLPVRRVALALILLRAGAEVTSEGWRWPMPTLQMGQQMEPNQAISWIKARIPAEARLRRCGYRLEQGVVVLAFDFPEQAQSRYGELLQSLSQESGWRFEYDTQVNQAALNSLAQEAVRELKLTVNKGPSLRLAEKEVQIKVNGLPDSEALERVAQQFMEVSGFTLTIRGADDPMPAAAHAAGKKKQWEINAAYAEIRKELTDSTLQRASLKGDRIVLSFISQQVGQRYAETIAQLERRIGWPIEINPQPTQGLILQIARELLTEAGWEIVKGPGIYIEKGQVSVRLSQQPDPVRAAEVQLAFTEKTGYELEMGTPPVAQTGPVAKVVTETVVLIPMERIQLQASHRGMELNAEKLEHALRRARQLGAINPPIRVRRLPQGYLLLDGLYRLHAARQLGWSHIQAVVE